MTRRVGLACAVAVLGVAGGALRLCAEEGLSERAAEAAALLESSDRYEQQLGFLRLEALREPATLAIVRPYAEHKDPELRADGLRAVAAIGGAASVPWLLARYKAERHPRVRRAILQALEPYRTVHPDIVSIYLRALRDRSTEVRMAAVDIVSRIDEPRAREALRERLRRERRRDVRRVLKALDLPPEAPGDS